MRAIILAAGRGTRMKNLTDKVPKCLVRLNGISLLEMQIRAIKKAGIENISIVTGYKKELIPKEGIVKFHNPFWSNTNMVSSLEYAEEWLSMGPCVVSYSDIFYMSDAINHLIECKSYLSITYDPNWLELWSKRFDNPLVDAETFLLNENSTLKQIGKKPKTIKEIQGQFMGLIRTTPEGWSEIKRIRNSLEKKTKDQMHMTDTLQKVIEGKNIAINAIPYFNTWGEVDSPNDVRIYNEHYKLGD